MTDTPTTEQGPILDRRLREGAIDVHVHADPCSLIARNQDFSSPSARPIGLADAAPAPGGGR